jgi:hypothetical protein
MFGKCTENCRHVQILVKKEITIRIDDKTELSLCHQLHRDLLTFVGIKDLGLKYFEV